MYPKVASKELCLHGLSTSNKLFIKAVDIQNGETIRPLVAHAGLFGFYVGYIHTVTVDKTLNMYVVDRLIAVST